VTAFVLRETGSQPELLLIQHPYAGIQIPAGTVEEGEAPQAAALREVAEETGLRSVRLVRDLGRLENELGPGECAVYQTTTVYARPDPGSFDWARLPRGATADILRTEGDWTQISYVEWDRYPDPQYVSMQITGWALNEHLAMVKQRRFFLLELAAPAPERWEQYADQHTFTLFWAPLAALPPIVEPQERWLRFLLEGR
jgi:8-oxo-dGTP pyrophosphatase MutT (NUDIX family)